MLSWLATWAVTGSPWRFAVSRGWNTAQLCMDFTGWLISYTPQSVHHNQCTGSQWFIVLIIHRGWIVLSHFQHPVMNQSSNHHLMECQPRVSNVTHLKNFVPRSVTEKKIIQEEKWYTGKSKAEAAAKAEKDLGQKASWQCGFGWPSWPFWEDKSSQQTTNNTQEPTNNNQQQKNTNDMYKQQTTNNMFSS